jgi:hypothetical protein
MMPQNEEMTTYILYAVIVVVFIIVLKMPKKKS